MNTIQYKNIGCTIQQSEREYTDLEDDQAGPVFVQLPDQMGWMKVNNFSACDQCRTSHVKCSLSVTGGPCSHCKNRNQLCKVYGWVFNPERPPYHIYKPVFPPPPAAPSSPLHSSQSDEYEFDWKLLVHKLNWLQREAPRKFRKRSSAMPWKDDPNVSAQEAQIWKCPQRHREFFEKANSEASVYDHFLKRRRVSKGSEIVNYQYDCEDEEPVISSTQHRMSISFILSSCDSEKKTKSEKKNDGSSFSSNGWQSRRTSLASSEAGWSTSSETRSPSLPSIDSLPKNSDSGRISFHSPPVPYLREDTVSKFQEWRPPLHSPDISAMSRRFSTIRRF